MSTTASKNNTSKKIVLILVALVSAGVIAATVWLIASGRFTVVANKNVIMTVRYDGGMCSDGPCMGEEYKLYDDGVFEGHAKVASQDMAELKQVIERTDFLQPSRDYTDTDGRPSKLNCESYVDGYDLVVRVPEKHGDMSFMPCSLYTPPGETSFLQYVEEFIGAHAQR